ncbi:MAG TPA: hypothetical protein VII68_12215, partial [Casimicrobiaceae bacterium]
MADPTPTHVSSPPAYAAAPRRSGLLYAVAGIVALAAVAAVAIFMLGGRSPAPVVVTPDARGGDAQKSADAAKATLDAASKSVLNPAPETPPVAEPPAAVVAAGSASAPPPASMPRTEARPAAPRPAPATTPAPAPAPKASSAPPKVDSPAPAASASPPAQVASADVWTQMRDEMARCSSSSVIPRIQCERRIRARYCDGHWGT